MSTYAIGDVQGCYDQLLALLDRIEFDRDRDRLWFAGDLVNRGPKSLEVLRLVHDLGDAAVTVLGNHDLHLLAAAYGHREHSPRDTLDSVLEAPDRDRLLRWLRHQPLMHRERSSRFVLVHAGVPPAWDLAAAERCARELETTLRDDDAIEPFLACMYGDEPSLWHPELRGAERLRFITNAFTRMRYVDGSGALRLDDSRPPGHQAPGLIPWFEARGAAADGTIIVFGHWATLERSGPPRRELGVVHVDTGCVWGGTLTAYRLEDGRSFQVEGWKGLATRD